MDEEGRQELRREQNRLQALADITKGQGEDDSTFYVEFAAGERSANNILAEFQGERVSDSTSRDRASTSTRQDHRTVGRKRAAAQALGTLSNPRPQRKRARVNTTDH